MIIDALKNKYSLPKLCRKLCISRSSYYYQESAMRSKDKYRDVRLKIRELFHNNYDAFGYRKIYTLLKREEYHPVGKSGPPHHARRRTGCKGASSQEI